MNCCADHGPAYVQNDLLRTSAIILLCGDEIIRLSCRVMLAARERTANAARALDLRRRTSGNECLGPQVLVKRCASTVHLL